MPRMTPSCGAAPYAPDPTTPEIRMTPGQHDRQRQQRGPRRPLAEQQPREEPDDDDLEVAEDGRQTGPDRLDGVVPEHQVAGEEDPGDGGQPDRLARQRAVAPPLPERDEDEQRQAEDRAVERPGRGLRPRRTGRRRRRTRCRTRRSARRAAAAAANQASGPSSRAQVYSSPDRYLSPESTWIVATRAPSPSRRATARAAVMLAPVDGPDQTPSSRAARRAIA